MKKKGVDGKGQRNPSSSLRLLFIATGSILLVFAGLFNYSSPFLFADGWRIFIHLPKMEEHLSFSVWWPILTLPALLFGLGLTFPVFRKALVALRRGRKSFLSLFLVSLFLAFSLFPWEYSWVRPSRSHIVVYLILGSSGFTLFFLGVYQRLKFFDKPVSRINSFFLSLSSTQFMLTTFLFFFLITNLISFFIFEHIPHISDSIAQLFQGRIFASGRLYLTSPKFPDFFDHGHIINHGRWYSQYPFLHSLLLMFGVFFHAPWLINPLLGSFTILFIYLLGREVYGERVGRLGTILASLSPFLFSLSAEYMNHTSALLFTTLFLLFYFRTLRRRNWSDGFLAGIFLGLVVNGRPYTAFALSLPFALYGVYLTVKRPGDYLSRFLLMLFGLFLTGSLLFIYNWFTNGHPLLFGYVVKWGPGHEVGFGKSGWGIKHTPLRGLVNIGHDLNLLNKFLFEWPIPGLLPIGVSFLVGTRDERDWLFLLLFFSLYFAHFFYWFHGIAFGARFLSEATPALYLLTVRGAGNLRRLLCRLFGIDIPEEKMRKFFCRFIPLLFLLTISLGLPPLLRNYWGYWGVDGRVLGNVRRHKLENALVFCKDLGNAFNANPLNLSGEVIFAQDYGFLNSALTIEYPNRKYYYANKDTLLPIFGIDYPNSALKRRLEEMASFLDDSLFPRYRFLIIPFKDIPISKWDSSKRLKEIPWKEKITDFREVTQEVMTKRKEFEDYLPALAFWLVGDPRSHLEIFRYLERSPYFVAGGYKFKRLWRAKDGLAVIYEIRQSEEK